MMLSKFVEPVVAAMAKPPCHEGPLADSPTSDSLSEAIGEATLTLQIDPATGCVLSAGHQGTGSPPSRTLLDLLCATAIGLPMDEVAAHGVGKVLHAVARQAGKPLVAGILLPKNAGAIFVAMEAALRQMRDLFHARSGAATPPRSRDVNNAWTRLSDEGREARLAAAVESYVELKTLADDSIVFQALENDVLGRPVRVVLSFSTDCAFSDQLPAFIRDLERHLRLELLAPIEVLAGEQQDRNKLRRLILVKGDTSKK